MKPCRHDRTSSAALGHSAVYRSLTRPAMALPVPSRAPKRVPKTCCRVYVEFEHHCGVFKLTCHITWVSCLYYPQEGVHAQIFGRLQSRLATFKRFSLADHGLVGAVDRSQGLVPEQSRNPRGRRLYALQDPPKDVLRTSA